MVPGGPHMFPPGAMPPPPPYDPQQIPQGQPQVAPPPPVGYQPFFHGQPVGYSPFPFYPNMYPMYPMMQPLPPHMAVVMPDGFDASARFDGISRPSIPVFILYSVKYPDC